jgi:hypothetical protein
MWSAVLPVALWDQLVRLWQLIVLVGQFLWSLLKLLSGAG